MMNRIADMDKEIAKMDERFTTKLHRLLEEAEEQGFTDVIQWDPGGRSFTIYKPEMFAETIMKKYFKQTKYKSFQRQLNFYDFQRETRNGIRGVYYHPFFVRHDPSLSHEIRRKTRSRKLQAANKRQKNEVAVPPPEISIPHPFDSFAKASLRSTEEFHDIKSQDYNPGYGKEKKDDDTIETIDGYVEDVESGELFKVWKPASNPTTAIADERESNAHTQFSQGFETIFMRGGHFYR